MNAVLLPLFRSMASTRKEFNPGQLWESLLRNLRKMVSLYSQLTEAIALRPHAARGGTPSEVASLRLASVRLLDAGHAASGCPRARVPRELGGTLGSREEPGERHWSGHCST